MKPMNQILKANPEILSRIESIKQSVVQHPDVKSFLEQHPEVSDEMIDKDLSILQEFKDQSRSCEQCGGYLNCKNFVKGHIPELYIQNNRIKIKYLPCPSKLHYDEEQKMKEFVTALYISDDILEANLSSVYLDNKSRIDIVKQAMEVCNLIADDQPVKCMYIHGPFGTGKSYILGAIANQLKQKHKYSTIMYVPEFIRSLKAGFNDGTYESKLEHVKNAPVLMLDDIGAEDITPWVRDEVIGPILHYRMTQHLPTFFSSNFSYDELLVHFQSTRQGEEMTKAYRIMERIKALTNSYELHGKNYRHLE